jgi:hypothetical protein
VMGGVARAEVGGVAVEGAPKEKEAGETDRVSADLGAPNKKPPVDGAGLGGSTFAAEGAPKLNEGAEVAGAGSGGGGALDVAGGAPKLNGFDGDGAPVVVAGVTVEAGVCTGVGAPQAVAAFFSGSFFCSFSISPLNLPSSTSSRRLFSSSPTAR